MNPGSELPMRVVGKRQKTLEERFADLQRNGLPFWKGRKKGIEVRGADGKWKPYERGARRNSSAHN